MKVVFRKTVVGDSRSCQTNNIFCIFVAYIIDNEVLFYRHFLSQSSYLYNSILPGLDNFNKYKEYMSTKTHIVAEAVVDALSVQSPQTRYVVGMDAQLIWLPLTKLPTCVADFILNILGPPPTPQSVLHGSRQ